MQKKNLSLVEYAESLGFTRAADDDPIYTEGIIVVSTVKSALEKLEQEVSARRKPRGKNG